MSSKQIRLAGRYIHLVTGALLVAFIYSTSLRESPSMILLMQVGIVPLVIVTGMVMWQLPRLNKLWRRTGAKTRHVNEVQQ